MSITASSKRAQMRLFREVADANVGIEPVFVHSRADEPFARTTGVDEAADGGIDSERGDVGGFEERAQAP